MIPSAGADRSAEGRIKVSVIIPVYNGSRTIQATLDSVLQQTFPADEILVMDDGSTDSTFSLLESYMPRVTVMRQVNRGVAAARNALCGRARGDLLAFLDMDDIWHPRYIETQQRLFKDNPNAVALFTGHVNFFGYGNYRWTEGAPPALGNIQVMPPLAFSKRYNNAPGLFGSMSFCCIPKWVMMKAGREPFCVEASGADDFCLFQLLPGWGPVVYAPVPLVAYRLTDEAQSADQLKVVASSVRAFEILDQRYKISADGKVGRVFRASFSARRRLYAKVLMGAGERAEARRQLSISMRHASDPTSRAKSATLLFLTYLPAALQPTWPPRYRQSQRT